MRQMVLATAGVALIALIACNGGLFWLYQHSSLGVVITLGTFIAAGAAAWLRNRGKQLAAIVLYVQGLVGVSAVVGTLVALKAGVFTGIFAAGITLVGLVLLSLIGLLYYTGERGRTSIIVSSGTAIAVVVSMIGAYGFLTWDYHETTYRTPYVEPPQDAVYWLIEDGQTYTGDPDTDDPEVAESFEDYTCPASRDEIEGLFKDLVVEGKQRLASPENLKVKAQGTQDDRQIATVTARISVIDDFDEKVIKGPETWTFHLEKRPGDEYWRTCHIDRPA
jgi:hypothetical protein